MASDYITLLPDFSGDKVLDGSSTQMLKGSGISFEVGGPQGLLCSLVLTPFGSGMCVTGGCGWMAFGTC